MNSIFNTRLQELAGSGNLRAIPADGAGMPLIDFSSNDYLGLATDTDLRQDFFKNTAEEELLMTASASRLLARRQDAFNRLEAVIEKCYASPALLFNSGYHANTGLISALADKDCTILADKLVHASIIDGIRLSGAPFERFRHNDTAHLERLAQKASAQGQRLLIVVESVYSMDGDTAPLEEIIDIKMRYPDALLYVDEAHAVGVCGPCGLGEVAALNDDRRQAVDVVVGTLGKALASAGAYAVMKEELRSWAVNKARSFIFSTALPPACALWSIHTFQKAIDMESERLRLRRIGCRVAEAIGSSHHGHIQPFMVGDPQRAVMFSQLLKTKGLDVLPIRTPTVPPGTDRLRISLSAAHSDTEIDSLIEALKSLRTNPI